jgi:hypothetical protein
MWSTAAAEVPTLADLVDGGAGPDRLSGNDGDDEIKGGDGEDILYGDDGTDALYGSFDQVNGNAGDDVLHGGNSLLRGDEGRDTFFPVAGDDMWGGPDAITVDFSGWNVVIHASIDGRANDGKKPCRRLDRLPCPEPAQQHPPGRGERHRRRQGRQAGRQ